MPKLFGTDGVRGVANEDLTPELCLKIGRAAGEYLKSYGDTVLVGRDTRLSGTMLEAALSAGLASVGLKVERLGIVTTPAVAFLASREDVAGGAMISASHNPVPDNGVKFFDNKGYKLAESHEEQIENYLEKELSRPTGTDIGKVLPENNKLIENYIQELIDKYPLDLSNYKIVLDCAYGATYQIAPRLFKKLGAEIIPLHAENRGEKINVECGSTNPELTSRTVVEEGADLGFSFDGDGDRIIALDEEGNQVNGDKIMAILAKDMKSRGELKNDKLIATVMSNLGLKLALKELGIALEETKVGDRNVLNRMREQDCVLGGEQSGHIINLQDNTTGDGVLTGLKLMKVLIDTGQSLKQLASIMEELPQLLVNVKVSNKDSAINSQKVQEEKSKVEKQLGSKGRVLIRPSGTEPVIRVMVEGENRETLHEVANHLTQVIKKAAE
ncbi:phosphoglucosamine mutase [Natranaerobius thermophilus]|uniref:Phosphoglucosamine mutase n=1 Tax=Natranaerobius thermophilus (strain ATCC BAA-1301 / DSM 18059 / JW/NM-WN-LF) TaxID=457570 RepID=GLMM_NATTJ|nr:phosphoglucosamine mutase [Natranaerobius thermophilus]B2A4R9.1 RecName: Full=Phosphoglucosamine mutase [Natranaerobius thermophilus JW/NM-WN-LF]ACB83841.1 phosphoglucosamine mutase [Natranaerobius thermophilus JW/NM-WN-LF]